MKFESIGGDNDGQNTCLQRIESLGHLRWSILEWLSERGREMSEEARRRRAYNF